MRVTVLTWLESEQATEHDVVVDQVARALEAGGHRVAVVGVHGDLGRLVDGLKRTRPQLVFNLMEMFEDNLLGDVAVAGLLDLVGVPFTGCGAGELYLRQDKALAKKILHYEGIAYPRFAVFAKDAGFEIGGNLRMPLFVKPLRGDASIGVDAASLVRDSSELMRRVLDIHERVHDSALAEEFIEGREFYVGILGNDAGAQALPIIEMDFSGMPAGKPHILDERAKFDESSAEFKGTRAVVADLPDELRAKLQKLSLDAYRALRVRDYGRVDLRLTGAGEPYVIEVNASCYLEAGGEFAMAASAAGIGFVALVNRIVELALERFRHRTQPVAARPAAVV